MFSFSIDWIGIDSIKKFCTLDVFLKEIVIDSLAFSVSISPFIKFPKEVVILIGGLVFVLFFIMVMYKKARDYEKSIAEILETGYFINFIDRTARYLSDQAKKEKATITIKFQDDIQHEVEAKKVRVKVILPLSKESLKTVEREVIKSSKLGNIDNNAWVNAKITNDGLTIYEYPRTMNALSQYLSNSIEYTEKKSMRLHKIFKDKFEKDWENLGEKLYQDIFVRSYEFIE